MEGGSGHANLRLEGGKSAILPDRDHPAGAALTFAANRCTPAAREAHHSATDPSACRQTGLRQSGALRLRSMTSASSMSTPSPGRRGGRM